MLGPGEQHLRVVKILNKVIEWNQKKSISCEADSRHVEIPVKQLELENAKSVAKPGTK